MKKRSKLWTEPDPSAPPFEPAPKANVDAIIATLTEDVDQKPTEEELAKLTDRLRQQGQTEAAEMIDAE